MWCWLATKVHITYPLHILLKINRTETSIVALSALVDSSTWIVCHGDTCINPC